jgi:diguanylate cyclase (GGDEF)-like protein/PAS domain S-box-containing protein
MKDEQKTKEQLISELNELRQEIAESKKVETRVVGQDEDWQDQSEIFQSILDCIGDGVVVADKDGKFLLWNPVAKILAGMGPSDVDPDEWAEHYGIFLPDTVTPLPKSEIPLLRAIRGEVVDKKEVFLKNKNKPEGAWLCISARPLTSHNGIVRGGVCVFRDITDRKLTEEAIKNLARFPTENPNPIFRIAKDGRILYCNPAGQNLLHEWACKMDQLVAKDWQQVIENLHGANKEIERKCGDQTYSFMFMPVADADYVNVYGRDITERIQVQDALAEQAIRDTLTHLYNRRYFDHWMIQELSRANRNKKSVAILLCDLDRFKTINDTSGHQIGDEVLKRVAQSIQESTRGTDSVFRWGGDEFVVVLSDTTRDGILIAAERIRGGIHKLAEQGHFDLDLSIGISLYPQHANYLTKLIRIADQALYIAKKGGDKIHIGEEEYRLNENTIRVVFQPVMDIRMNQTLGYEALSRDAQEKISILDFFKKYQAIGKLNELKCLCYQLQMKKAREIGINKVFINVDFNVLRQLQPLPPPSNMEVVLEISEAEALHDFENRLAIAKEWREHGYKFAIDDFGAGFISLPFIARLIPDHIKLDRSTILQAVASKEFKRILKDLLVGLRKCSTDGIIAEGIESAKELEVVKDLGVYLVQGYLFGKPEELKRENIV